MIVITSPTGRIGRQVLDRLLATGTPTRVIARDPSRLPPDARERAEVVPGSHRDPAVVDRAFTGADAVFWLVPPNPRADDFENHYVDFSRPACEAFRSQGVKRVVGISALGRGTPLAGHAGLVTASLAMDDFIAGTGVSYRALALPSFMDNLLDQVESIRSRGVFALTLSPDRRLPTCSTGDIAGAAAGLLLDGSWTGQGSVPVLGPEDLSYNEMAQIMSQVLGRPVRYQQVSMEDFRAGLTGRGMSTAMTQGMIDMMVAKDRGLDNAEPRTARSATPTSFHQWCAKILRPAVLSPPRPSA